MFDSHLKPTGTQITPIAALLVVALIFVPILLITLRPIGFSSMLMAVSCSTLCLFFAPTYWKRYSQLPVPTLERRDPRLK
jgi:hypothetical protein